ncbi:MAG: polysaccharide deacetylase family protein [Proteobacteria bacterium]|nr:polysaccharide deacetylase family protein [Pseudomonadota bacterium]
MFRMKLWGLALVGCLYSFTSFAYDKEIAITIDDLPFVGSANNNPAKLQREHDRFMSILNALVENKVPATGFVIAGSIEKGQWELLEAFQQAGLTLGNHTFSHLNLNTTNTDKYIANVDRADKILSSIMPSETKYFRYPYLAEGRGDKKQKVIDYLSLNHYTIAPVTIDSKDFRFNERLYKIPYRLRAQNLNQMKKQYLAYIWDQTVRAEKRAGDKPVKQILLIHSNLINSYFLADIIKMYQEHGYKFITLGEALEQPAPAINVSKKKREQRFDLFDDNLMDNLFSETVKSSTFNCCFKS